LQESEAVTSYKALARLVKGRISVLKEILGHPLSSHERLRTLWRYGKWNLFRVGIDSKVVLPMPGGLQIIAPNRANFSTGLYLQALYDLPGMVFFCHFMREGDLLADVGANVGAYGLLAAKVTGCDLIACEPAPDTFATLSDNVRLNQLEPLVELHNVAVGEEDGYVLLTRGGHGLNHVLTSGVGTKVAISRLDDLVRERPVAALKIDVEGYELRVLQGAPKVLADQSLKAVKVEINGLIRRYGATEDDLRNHLAQHGFAQTSYDPLQRHLAPSEATEELWVRDLDYVMKRLSTAPPLAVGARKF
jgi:FkbM family methyltransferase